MRPQLAESPAPRLVVEGVTKSYARNLLPGRGPAELVFRDVSFSLAPGEIMVLRGPNGSGKTTLLKILAGLVEPDTGSVRSDAVTVGFSTGEERSLSWRLTALHNLELFGVLQGMNWSTAQREAGELLHALGLGDRMSYRVQALSSGQRQRVLVARALMGAPGLVLLDEPTGRMDEESMEATWDLLRRRAAAGTTILLSTQRDEDESRADAVGTIVDWGLLARSTGPTVRAISREPASGERASRQEPLIVGTLRRLAAFFRRDFAVARSYPVPFALQLFGVLLSVPSLYFLGHVVGSGSSYLRQYGGQYFPFAALGTAIFLVQTATLSSFAGSVRENQLTGTLEAMLATRARLPTVLVGSALWGMFLGTLQFFLLLVTGMVFFGLRLLPGEYAIPALVLVLSILSGIGLGLAEAAFVLVMKRGSPVTLAFGMVSNLLGGLLYPVAVLPGVLLLVSGLVPLTHAANALRFALLAGRPGAALGETLALAALTILYLGAGMILAFAAYSVGRKRGTLGQY